MAICTVNDLVTYAVADDRRLCPGHAPGPDALPYLQTLPEDLFLAYVLPPGSTTRIWT